MILLCSNIKLLSSNIKLLSLQYVFLNILLLVCYVHVQSGPKGYTPKVTSDN